MKKTVQFNRKARRLHNEQSNIAAKHEEDDCAKFEQTKLYIPN